MGNDARTLRDRSHAAQDTLDRLLSSAPDASAAVLLKTVAVGTYPTTAGTMYACHVVECNGDETEGAAVSYVADEDSVLYALNLGTEIPDEGTHLVASAVGGRLVFRFD